MSIRIAVDAMGGDYAPRAIVDGAVAAARHLDLGVLLVGDASALAGHLERHPDLADLDVRIVDAPEVVDMAESPATALRRKPRASIRVAAAAVAHGEADALVSAGHTGATVLAAHAAFGMLPGVDRPALATAVPTRLQAAVLLDCGATLECRPVHLLQFAVMGSVYARVAYGTERPRVGLLSIGEEETKGNDLTREAHRLLKASPLNFIGNVEAREVYKGSADVIVCDGFTGNIALKISESLVEMIAALSGGALGAVASRRLDEAEYGGALLVGVRGVVIVGHGRSSARAVENAVLLAQRFVDAGVLARFERGIAAIPVSAS